MKPVLTLYRDTVELSVARFRLHQARTLDGFVPVRLSEPATRHVLKPSLIQTLLKSILRALRISA